MEERHAEEKGPGEIEGRQQQQQQQRKSPEAAPRAEIWWQRSMQRRARFVCFPLKCAYNCN